MTDKCQQAMTVAGGHKVEAEHFWPFSVFSGRCICGAFEWSPRMEQSLAEARQFVNRNKEEVAWNALQVTYLPHLDTIAVQSDRPTIVDLVTRIREGA